MSDGRFYKNIYKCIACQKDDEAVFDRGCAPNPETFICSWCEQRGFYIKDQCLDGIELWKVEKHYHFIRRIK